MKEASACSELLQTQAEERVSRCCSWNVTGSGQGAAGIWASGIDLPPTLAFTLTLPMSETGPSLGPGVVEVAPCDWPSLDHMLCQWAGQGRWNSGIIGGITTIEDYVVILSFLFKIYLLLFRKQIYRKERKRVRFAIYWFTPRMAATGRAGLL